ncbi:hypothetical protein LWI28_020691 [Acer negundo]|uniref:Uncharacterized protein n=1 Tax=Acer negundo TaxID=4023 RepID=A0AAD5IMI9_ACENE|nr:hypothetical protein LWI28_020691 [Acer negundo]
MLLDYVEASGMKVDVEWSNHFESAMESEDNDFYSGGDDGNDAGPAYAFDSDDESIDNDTDDSDDLTSHRPLFV